jgi:hypothetical protein
LKPEGPILFDEDSNALEFDAQVLGDVWGTSKGDNVHVELALFGGGGRLCGVLDLTSSSYATRLPAQLLLGMPCSATDPASFDLLMNSRL